MTKMRSSVIVLLMLSLVVLVAADVVGQAIRLPSDGADAKGLADGDAAASLVVGERPWKCCDRSICTRSFPPICRCLDTVKQCAATCKNCQKSSLPSRHVCADTYMGWPGPACTRPKKGDADVFQVMPEAVETAVAVAVAVAVAEENERPWECCDSPLCSRSIPPRCRCRDIVEQCGDACKRCEKSPSSPNHRVCMDVFKGWPGPTCANLNEADAVVQVISAAAAKEEEVLEERPWGCCTKTVCTRSFPPTCRCRDRVEECHPACQACHQVSRAPDKFICQDSYKGQPGPAC